MKKGNAMDLSSLSPKKQVKIQYWLKVIHDCRASGMTNLAFCEQNGISIKSYYYWIALIRKLALEDIPRKPLTSRLTIRSSKDDQMIPVQEFEEVPIRVPGRSETTPGQTAAVIQANGIRVEVFEHTSDPMLRRIVKAVQDC